MSLGDIRNKLYKKKEEKNLAQHDQSQYDPRIGNLPQQNAPTGNIDIWENKKAGFDENQKKAIKKGAIALGGVIFLILILLGAYFIRKAAFSQDRVLVTVTGPAVLDSGNLVSYEITCKNNNWSTLKNSVLKLSFPADFKPENNSGFTSEGILSGKFSLGDISGYGEKKIVFSGRAYSPKGALMYLTADLLYSPSGYSSQFISTNKLGMNVSSSPVTLEVLGPQNVANGDEINYAITYKNSGDKDLEGLRIKVDYPEGFVFSASDPKVSEQDNTWYIGILSPGQSGKISISGKLSGEKDQIKNLKVHAGVVSDGQFVSYSEGDAKTQIASSPITVSQLVNNVPVLNVNAGETLRFAISYKNEGNIGLSNLIVTEKIDSPVLDYTTLVTNGGFFDTATKTITWKASDHIGLKYVEPNKGGSIEFIVKVKDVIPMSNDNDKNYVVSGIVKVDSPDIPTPVNMNKIVAGNRIDAKLNSKLILNARGFYKDSSIANNGPIPPKVGEETSYTIHWILANVSNDVSDARVEAVLPTGVSMTGEIYPEGENIKYNERNNSIVWEAGNLNAGVGIISNPREAAFQVKIKPSPDQVGRTAELLGRSVFSAKDNFTGENISTAIDEKSTQLTEDPSLGYNFRIVP